MNETYFTQYGSFKRDSCGIWHYRVGADKPGTIVFDAIEDALDFYRTELWDRHPGAAAWFWFNGVPCPIMGVLAREGRFQGRDLWERWQLFESAWNHDKAPNIKDVLDVVCKQEGS